jgi:hypothetical protein
MELIGFVQLQVGSLAVKVPVRALDQGQEPEPPGPLASFESEGENCAIVIRGDKSAQAVESAMGPAVKQAFMHLSRKLLN